MKIMVRENADKDKVVASYEEELRVALCENKKFVCKVCNFIYDNIILILSFFVLYVIIYLR